MISWRRKRQAVRQRPPRDWHAELARALLILSPYRRAGLIAVVGSLLIGSVAVGRWWIFSQAGAWPLQRVVICRLQAGQCEALQHTAPEAVRQATRELLQDGMLLVFPQAIQQALRQVAWVKRVQVGRQWPYSVRIDIEEYRPAARWWPDNAYCHAAAPHCELLGDDGALFKVAQADWDAALPCFSGPRDSALEVFEQYRQLQPLLEQYAHTIRCLHMSVHRDWDLTLADGTVLKLGKQALVPRLRRFFKVYPLVLRDSGDLQIAHFDLRYPNGLVVQWR